LNAQDPASRRWLRLERVVAGLRSDGSPSALRPARRGGFAIDFPPARSERYRIGGRALRGQHNLENAMAAALCARAMDVPADAVQKGLDSFPAFRTASNDPRAPRRRLSQRLEGHQRRLSVVGLRAVSGALWWIAGGRGKGAPYAPLRPLLEGRTRGMLLIGEDAQRLAGELAVLPPITLAGTLEAA